MAGKLLFVILLCVCVVSVAEAQKKTKKPKKRIGAIVKDMEQNMTELWKEVKMLSQPVHVHIHGDGHVMQGHEGHDHEHDMHDHFSHCHGKDHDHHQGHGGHGGHDHPGQDHEGHGHDSHGHDVHDHEGHDHEGHEGHGGHDHEGHEGHDHKGHKHDRKDKDKDHKHGHKHHDRDDKDKKKKKGKKGHHHHDHMMGHDDHDHEGHEGHMHGEGHDDEDYEAFHHGEGGTHVHIHLHTALEQMMNNMQHNQFRDPAMQMAVKPNTTLVPKVYRYARCEVTGNSDLPFLERQDIRGTIFFRQMPKEPLHVKVDLQGFALDHLLERSHSHLRGMHGHEYGDLTRGCTNMGGHFNPHGVHHGGPDDHTSRHPGDFGNLQIEEDGTVVTSFADNHGSLFGDDSLLGRGIVIHGGADDHGKGEDEGSRKSGNAGKRIACCAIVACPKTDTVWDD